MAISQTEILSELEELSTDAFEAFCNDISGMFGIDMESDLSSDSKETTVGLKKKFKKFCGVITVKATGTLNGDFHIIFDKEALFTLSGTIVMFPEKRILDNCKKGTLADAKEQHDAVGETGNLLAGSWDRIFRENLEGHTHFLQTGTFIGNPWNDSEKVLGVSKEEEFLYFGCEMTIGEFPAFQCGVIFPDSVFQNSSQTDTADTSEVKEEVSEDSKPEADSSAESQEVAEQTNKQVESQPQEETKEQETHKKEDQQVGSESQEEVKEPENMTPEDQEPEEKTDKQVQSEPPEEVKEPKTVETESKASEEPESKPGEAAFQEEKDSNQESQNDDTESEATELKQADAPTEHREAPEGAVSETIQKMVQSMPSPSDNTSSILNILAKDIMSKQVLWGKPDDSVQSAIEKIQQTDTSCMLIGDSDALQGIVTWVDVAEAVSIYLRPVFAKWRRPIDDATLQIKLKIIMTRPVRTIKPQTSLGAILEDMCQHRLRCLPVLNDQGKVEGVVTASDIFKFFLKMSSDFSITDSPAKTE